MNVVIFFFPLTTVLNVCRIMNSDHRKELLESHRTEPIDDIQAKEFPKWFKDKVIHPLVALFKIKYDM